MDDTRTDEEFINGKPLPRSRPGLTLDEGVVLARIDDARRERMLKTGFTYGAWNFNGSTLEHTKSTYWLEPSEVTDARSLVEWLCQINEKPWATTATLGQLFKLFDFILCGRCLAHPGACYSHQASPFSPKVGVAGDRCEIGNQCGRPGCPTCQQ